MISISQFVRNSQLWRKVTNSQVWHKVTESLNCCQHPFLRSLPRAAPPRKCPKFNCCPAPPQGFCPCTWPAPPQPEIFLFGLAPPRPEAKKRCPVHPWCTAHLHSGPGNSFLSNFATAACISSDCTLARALSSKPQ